MRAFETTCIITPDTLEENWRAYSIEDVRTYVHGDLVIASDVLFGIGRTENEAIANLCATNDGQKGQFLYLSSIPKYSIGQRVYVGDSISGFYGVIYATEGEAHIYDTPAGLYLLSPLVYTYSVKESSGVVHKKCLEYFISLVEEDGEENVAVKGEVIKPKQGWGYPLQARVQHYWNNSVYSLCETWLYTGELKKNVSVADGKVCQACLKKLIKLKNKENPSE